MNMVEKVADAIGRNLYGSNFEHLDAPEYYAQVREIARAAIAVIREPSDLMTYRGQNHRYDSRWSIGAIWREMIDAALSEG